MARFYNPNKSHAQEYSNNRRARACETLIATEVFDLIVKKCNRETLTTKQLRECMYEICREKGIELRTYAESDPDHNSFNEKRIFSKIIGMSQVELKTEKVNPVRKYVHRVTIAYDEDGNEIPELHKESVGRKVIPGYTKYSL